MHGKMSGGRTSAWALVLLILLQHLILCHGAYLSMNSNPGGFNSVGGILICAGDIFIVTQCRGDKIHGDPRIWLSGNAGTEFYNDDGCGGDDDSNDGWGVYLRYDRYTAGCETFTLKVGCNPDHNPCTGANPAYYFDRKVTRCGKGQYFSTISQACATVNQGKVNKLNSLLLLTHVFVCTVQAVINLNQIMWHPIVVQKHAQRDFGHRRTGITV